MMRFLLITALIAATSSAARGATVRTRDGKTYSGQVTIADGRFSIATAEGQAQSIAPAEVSAIDFRAAPAVAEPTTGPSTGPATAPALADAALAVGCGLRGEYFNDMRFADSKFVRGDPRIEFNFAPPNEPFPRKDPAARSEMSIRWTGQIRPRFSEHYSFFVTDYSVQRVWIDHRLIIDNSENHGEINLKAGRLYDLRVDWIARGDDADLQWSSPSQPRAVVQSACLFPPRNELNMPPNAVVASPSDGTVFAGPVDVPMTVKILPGSSTPIQVEYRDGPTAIGASKAAPFDFVWHHAPIGDHRVIAIVTDADGTTGVSAARHIVIGSDVQGSLPKGWVACEVPAPGVAELVPEKPRHAPRRPPRPHPAAPGDEPSAPPPPSPPPTFHDGTLTLKNTGGDVYAQEDRFQYVFHRLEGDGSVIARVADLASDQKNARPLAGVMIRTAASGPSPYVALLNVPSIGDVFLHRLNLGQEAANTSSTGQTPIYLKLTRKGFIVRAYRSSDGQKWEFMGETTVEMPNSMLVGIIACGGDPKVTATATFDHLQVTTAVDDDSQKFQPTVVLTDGTRLVGTLSRISKEDATLTPPAGGSSPVSTIPRDAIARILYRPLSSDALATLTSHQTGVFLEAGDFYEGQIDTLKAGRFTVNSVVFGPRDFNPSTVLAVILAPVAKPAGVEVDLADGSTIYSPSMALDAAGIELHGAAGAITVPLKDVRTIMAH